MNKYLILLLLSATSLFGQIAISSMTTQTTTGTSYTYNGATFDDTTRAITSVVAASGDTYTLGASGTDVFVRRNTTAGNANNASVTFAQNGNINSFASGYATNLNDVLLSNNLYTSSDNIFNVGTTTDAGNIARVDFLFNGTTGITAAADMNIAMFERGLTNQHDSFNVTLITGWDQSTMTPTSFTNINTISSLDFGPSNITVDGVSNFSYNYNLFRYNTGDDLSTWTQNNQTGNQGIGGVILNFLGFGSITGQTVYGYSIASSDSTTKANKFADWNDGRYFPTDTANGFDPYGVNGMVWNNLGVVVPEPSHYGMILMAGCIGLFVARRRPRL
jgi:hypothetical protein